MTIWRPENWCKDRPERKLNSEEQIIEEIYEKGYEAGADVMLEALRKDKLNWKLRCDSVEGESKIKTLKVIFEAPYHGYLVFIPDDEEK